MMTLFYMDEVGMEAESRGGGTQKPSIWTCHEGLVRGWLFFIVEELGWFIIYLALRIFMIASTLSSTYYSNISITFSCVASIMGCIIVRIKCFVFLGSF